MKTGLTFLLLALLSNFVMAQQDPSKKPVADEDLILKSRSQKSTAFIMLGLGAATTALGAIVFEENFTVLGESNNNAVTGSVVMAIAGGLSMLGSIPFFVASANNKQKAIAVGGIIKIERIISGNFKQAGTDKYPALAVRININ